VRLILNQSVNRYQSLSLMLNESPNQSLIWQT
jgi:hypothetical protein